ncbi:MAG TPA: hypothetical protein VGK58_13050 [Lacipirellulaceae bacterium]
MTRRRFAFWIGFGLFTLAEKLRFGGLDELAAATMRVTEPSPAVDGPATPVHWSAAENNLWRWYERETYVDGRWKLTGVTTPINKKTGKPYEGKSGYLEPEIVPVHVQTADYEVTDGELAEAKARFGHRRPNPTRAARHGRPPSKWLRSLNAEEIRIWLATVEVPEARVEGMTYWAHLTRDHLFDAEKIDGLSLDEQAKLHAAAHYGY